MAGGALEGRDSRRPIQRRVGEGPRREAGNWRGEAGESRRSGRAGACCARLPFWSRAAATAAGFGRKEGGASQALGCHGDDSCAGVGRCRSLFLPVLYVDRPRYRNGCKDRQVHLGDDSSAGLLETWSPFVN